MIYSREVEEMCPVAQGVHHGAAPIPEEAKWVQVNTWRHLNPKKKIVLRNLGTEIIARNFQGI